MSERTTMAVNGGAYRPTKNTKHHDRNPWPEIARLMKRVNEREKKKS